MAETARVGGMEERVDGWQGMTRPHPPPLGETARQRGADLLHIFRAAHCGWIRGSSRASTDGSKQHFPLRPDPPGSARNHSCGVRIKYPPGCAKRRCLVGRAPGAVSRGGGPRKPAASRSPLRTAPSPIGSGTIGGAHFKSSRAGFLIQKINTAFGWFPNLPKWTNLSGDRQRVHSRKM